MRWITLVLLIAVASALPAQVTDTTPEVAKPESAEPPSAVENPSQLIASRGNALFKSRDFSGCEAAYREGLVLNPKSVLFRTGLGKCLIWQRRYEEAGVELDYARQLAPRNTDALWYRALNYYYRGSFREAIVAFEDVLPNYGGVPKWATTVHFHIAESYRRMLNREGLPAADVDAMAAAFQRGLALAPHPADIEPARKKLAWIEANRPAAGEFWAAPAK